MLEGTGLIGEAPGRGGAIMATTENRMAGAFGLRGDAWLRHANPWSVYTRIAIPAALTGA